MKFIIKWTNKWSNEIGYVGSVVAKDKCFHNSDYDGAKRYANENAAQKAIATLIKYGEAENNNFEVIAVEC